MLFGGTITSSLIWESTQGRIERDKTEPWLWLSACGTFARPPHEAMDQREADLREGVKSENQGVQAGRKMRPKTLAPSCFPVWLHFILDMLLHL